MRVTSKKRRRVVVVGGGITGLSAAFYLQQEAKKNNLPIEIILIEASLRLGGKIQTLRKDGFIIERGPESFFDQSGSVRNLAANLGIEEDMVHHNTGQTYVAVGGELYPIPSGIMLGGAPQVSSFITSGLISLTGKIRAIGDLLLPKSPEKEDEPIGDFFRRRFGKEVVENLVEPLLAGTFAGDIDHLSIQAMFPQFFQLEKEHRSLLLGLKKNGKHLYPHIIGEQAYYETFQNGLETLVEALEKQIGACTILKGVRVEAIDKGLDDSMTIHVNNGTPIQADAVIMTSPFNATKEAFKAHHLMQDLPNMNYATIATVTMAFKREQIEKYKEAMSFFVSRNSDFVITSCTWSNRKWDNVAPDDCDLLRVYIGRVGDEAVVELSDTEIEKTVLQDLSRLLGIQDKPLFTVVTRWKQGMPQYTVGHEKRLHTMQKELMQQFPYVQIAGSSYEGISVPECVAQGKDAAQNILAKLLEYDVENE
ncbi:protoporphyrinogen oxidase [Metasolibacillus sp.]|uniref:protoporphyrinogen oxidase n=1 Tax=Metasolibacillus sp. TaxID=2703680 RepID=UPI0025E21A39|nr:protoporphyrinogen oxidase [Metasolibacillus sp.]MCT6924651.1 protoporphyrinogen oxidase [Metasolibacillus sp.]MCT6940853.1 protoporphyrinogen oxidase [Metasolibacillus sp.]